MSTKTQFNFRKAQLNDIKIVKQMMQELADLYGGTNEPKLTEQDLIRDSGLSGGAEICHIYVLELLIENQSFIIGYAICNIIYSSWVGKSYALEDIYVRPAYRGIGAGARIFCGVAAKAYEFDCKQLDFHVLAHNPSATFYKKFGAVNLTESKERHYFRLKSQEMEKLINKLNK